MQTMARISGFQDRSWSGRLPSSGEDPRNYLKFLGFPRISQFLLGFPRILGISTRISTRISLDSDLDLDFDSDLDLT